jgi:Xaa-Pro dipeptidase
MEMKQHDRLGFSLAEYRRRYDAVREGMRRLGVDALLVRSPENICYLTGYETPGYYKYHGLIISADEPVFVLRRFEEPNVWEFSWLARTVPIDDHQHPVQVTAEALERLGLGDKRLGVEKSGWYFSVEEYEALRTSLPKATMVDATSVTWKARVVKSDEEIGMMRRAARIADAATRAGIDAVAVGRTEDQVAAEVHRVAIEQGSEYMGLPPFVLSGERTCLPHGTWRGRRIQAGDHVYFEVSAAKFRYSAAIMRCVSLGQPNPRVKAMADAVIGGLEAGMAAIKPGVSCEAVDTACRSVIERAGFGKYFTHRTGYSIGVNFPPDWGEGEILSLRRGEPTPLEPNMTFHMVPLCLVYRELGVGFSATVRVTESGCEELTSLPRTLAVK